VTEEVPKTKDRNIDLTLTTSLYPLLPLSIHDPLILLSAFSLCRDYILSTEVCPVTGLKGGPPYEPFA